MPHLKPETANIPFAKAISLAVALHAGQVRKGLPVPYIIHPVEAVKQLQRWDVDDDVAFSAAILHDVLEECPPLTAAELACATGPRIAGIVDELTHLPGSMSKQTYLATFRTKSPEAVLIKLADRYCNVQDFILTDVKYARKYLRMADPLLDALLFQIEPINARFGRNVGWMAYEDFKRLGRSLFGG